MSMQLQHKVEVLEQKIAQLEAAVIAMAKQLTMVSSPAKQTTLTLPKKS